MIYIWRGNPGDLKERSRKCRYWGKQNAGTLHLLNWERRNYPRREQNLAIQNDNRAPCVTCGRRPQRQRRPSHPRCRASGGTELFPVSGGSGPARTPRLQHRKTKRSRRNVSNQDVTLYPRIQQSGVGAEHYPCNTCETVGR